MKTFSWETSYYGSCYFDFSLFLKLFKRYTISPCSISVNFFPVIQSSHYKVCFWVIRSYNSQSIYVHISKTYFSRHKLNCDGFRSDTNGNAQNISFAACHIVKNYSPIVN
jgi:hypothetical protein